MYNNSNTCRQRKSVGTHLPSPSEIIATPHPVRHARRVWGSTTRSICAVAHVVPARTPALLGRVRRRNHHGDPLACPRPRKLPRRTIHNRAGTAHLEVARVRGRATVYILQIIWWFLRVRKVLPQITP